MNHISGPWSESGLPPLRRDAVQVTHAPEHSLLRDLQVQPCKTLTAIAEVVEGREGEGKEVIEVKNGRG